MHRATGEPSIPIASGAVRIRSLGLGGTPALLRALLAAVLAIAVLSCTPVSNSYPTLVNQGLLALSTSNPYLGANLFLAGELERSRYLFNFFQHRGAPVAIEIIQPRLSSTRILLYYPQSKEVYAADLVEDEKKREWIVRGPFAIERQDFRTLARMETSMAGEPVFELHGKPYRFRFQRSAEPSQVARPVIPEVAPTPTPTPKPKHTRKVITAPKTPTVPPTPTIDLFKPLTSDQQALLMARGFAKRDVNGDVLHQVRAGQTLEAIVTWYTGSTGGLDQVRSASKLAADAVVSDGQTVRIPFALVKEGKAMP